MDNVFEYLICLWYLCLETVGPGLGGGGPWVCRQWPGSPLGMTAVLQCCMRLLKASCPGHYWLHGEQFLVNNNYLRVPETSSKLDAKTCHRVCRQWSPSPGCRGSGGRASSRARVTQRPGWGRAGDWKFSAAAFLQWVAAACVSVAVVDCSSNCSPVQRSLQWGPLCAGLCRLQSAGLTSQLQFTAACAARLLCGFQQNFHIFVTAAGAAVTEFYCTAPSRRRWGYQL